MLSEPKSFWCQMGWPTQSNFKPVMQFLATLVALHLTPVSRSLFQLVSQQTFDTGVDSRSASLLLAKNGWLTPMNNWIQSKTSPQAKLYKLSLLFTSLTISTTLDFITKLLSSLNNFFLLSLGKISLLDSY